MISSRLCKAALALSMSLVPLAAAGQDYVDYNAESAGAVTESDVDVAGDVSYESSQPLAWDADAQSTAPSGEAAAPAAADREKRKPWEWGGPRHHSNLLGGTGLLHLSEAGSGPAGTFGFGIHGTWFKYDQYLYNQDGRTDTHTGMWAGMNLRITFTDFLEAHANISAVANHNNRENPELFQSLGDTVIGLKGFYTFADWVTLGLDATVALYNSVGDVAVDWSGTSFGFDALTTFDFNRLNDKAPLRGHLLLGYYFDRTANLVSDLEKAHGGCGADNDGDGDPEYSGCLSPIERTSLGINRNDQFRWGLGLDAPFPYISPMLEYKMEVPVNRQDFVCPTDVPNSNDSCMDVAGASGLRQVLTIGARVLPPIEDLAIDLGVDIGLSGYAPSVQELAAEAPYRLIFGLSYNIDPFPDAPPPLPPPPPAPEPLPPPAPPAHISGLIHAAGSVDKPIAGAKVTYVGLELNSQIAGRDGRFTSYELPAGTVKLRIEAVGYVAGTFDVAIPDTGLVEQKLGLKEEIKKGTISGQVVGDEDKPLDGIEIKVEGPTSTAVTSGADGKFSLEADDGNYLLSVSAEGYMSKRIHTDVKGGLDTRVQISLRPKPKKMSVVIKNKVIQITKKIQFKTDSDEIDPVSFPLCDEIASLVVDHPELKQIEVQGHTDDRGKRDYNVDLSERRAASVRRYLIDAGVESDRLTSKGFGPDKPIAPNITAGGRAQNRRVELHIIDRTE
jgi:OmpA-OmpF porin, OOP family